MKSCCKSWICISLFNFVYFTTAFHDWYLIQALISHIISVMAIGHIFYSFCCRSGFYSSLTFLCHHIWSAISNGHLRQANGLSSVIIVYKFTKVVVYAVGSTAIKIFDKHDRPICQIKIKFETSLQMFVLTCLTAVKILDKHDRPICQVEGHEDKRYDQLCHSFNLGGTLDFK